MVAFEQGDPSRPFVAGSLFHMNNTSGMVADNNIKAITTRSGHTIEFDDTDGAEKIHIRDNGRSEEQTAELQSRPQLVCRLLLEKKKATSTSPIVAMTVSSKWLPTAQSQL